MPKSRAASVVAAKHHTSQARHHSTKVATKTAQITHHEKKLQMYTKTGDKAKIAKHKAALAQHTARKKHHEAELARQKKLQRSHENAAAPKSRMGKVLRAVGKTGLASIGALGSIGAALINGAATLAAAAMNAAALAALGAQLAANNVPGPGGAGAPGSGFGSGDSGINTGASAAPVEPVPELPEVELPPKDCSKPETIEANCIHEFNEEVYENETVMGFYKDPSFKYIMNNSAALVGFFTDELEELVGSYYGNMKCCEQYKDANSEEFKQCIAAMPSDPTTSFAAPGAAESIEAQAEAAAATTTTAAGGGTIAKHIKRSVRRTRRSSRK